LVPPSLKQEAKLKAARVHIFVRRGGPNYQTGLAKMRALGEEFGVPIQVRNEDDNLCRHHALKCAINLLTLLLESC